VTTTVCVGLAVQDIVMAVAPLPEGPGKRFATDRIEVGGGPAANAAATIVSLGGDARFIGAVGDDRLGAEIVVELNGLGVDTSRIRTVPGARSPLSVAAVDDRGERAVINHLDAALFAGADPVAEEDLAGADAVLADVRWPDGAVGALGEARRLGIPGVLDFDLGSSDEDELLASASHVVFAEDALRRLTGTDDLGAALGMAATRTDAWVGVTAGAAGSFWLEDGSVRNLPALPVEVVDTLGAGDVYHGAFAMSLAENAEDIAGAIRLATGAAALSCTRFGGRHGIPTAMELAAFLDEQP
jgi:sulfofructose kinase